jgi:hypothetical protein
MRRGTTWCGVLLLPEATCTALTVHVLIASQVKFFGAARARLVSSQSSLSVAS